IVTLPAIGDHSLPTGTPCAAGNTPGLAPGSNVRQSISTAEAPRKGTGPALVYLRKPDHARSRCRCQLADAVGEVVPGVAQPDPAGRPGRSLHPGRAAQGPAARARGDRGRDPRLR